MWFPRGISGFSGVGLSANVTVPKEKIPSGPGQLHGPDPEIPTEGIGNPSGRVVEEHAWVGHTGREPGFLDSVWV